MGDDESFDISCTDLINKNDTLDEIAINVVKSDDNWVNINIHIPSATVVIAGEGLENFKSIILPKITAREQLYFAQRKTAKNDPFNTTGGTSYIHQTPSVIDLTTKNTQMKTYGKK